MQDLVIINGKLRGYNFMHHEIIGYKQVRRVIGGEVYAVSMPVARVRTSGEIKSLLFYGLIGAVLMWASLVLMIRLAPIPTY